MSWAAALDLLLQRQLRLELAVDSGMRLVDFGGVLQVVVQAVGLNFRDVLNILGMYPGDPGEPGGDCAGVVTAVGPGALRFSTPPIRICSYAMLATVWR